MEIIWTKTAKNDLNEIVEYIAYNSVEIAINKFNEISNAVNISALSDKGIIYYNKVGIDVSNQFAFIVITAIGYFSINVEDPFVIGNFTIYFTKEFFRDNKINKRHDISDMGIDFFCVKPWISTFQGKLKIIKPYC